ncbi:MAG: hypothetical protein K0A98_04490 [Trueperaceae bacterium]|nr:hypothetical protein [Trueperaceae bacterium]
MCAFWSMAVRVGRYDPTAFLNLVISLGRLFNHLQGHHARPGNGAGWGVALGHAVLAGSV